MKFFMILIFVITLFLFRDGQCLHLNNITVPPVVVIDGGDTDPIILDCDYDVEDDSKFFVLKWLKNNVAIYQWIRGQEPSVFPNFRDQVDETFSISSDPKQKYKGLSLTNPNMNTTGIYKCLIQTAKATFALEQKLQIVDISNYSLNVYHKENQNETQLECKVDEVYPEPTIHLTTNEGDIVPLVTSKPERKENGFYSGTATAVIDPDDMDTDGYICTVTFIGFPRNLTATVNSRCSVNTILNEILILCISSAVLFYWKYI